MKQELPQAVFLDRDGTIGERGRGRSLAPEQFELYPFSARAIADLKSAGIKVFSFTNQPWIQQGETTYEEVERQLLSFGFDRAYICPHGEGSGCSCRKPLPGMLTRASKEWKIDLKNCAVIGDSWRDMLAADAVGAKKILLKTGEGQRTLLRLEEKYPELSLDHVCENLKEAAELILRAY